MPDQAKRQAFKIFIGFIADTLNIGIKHKQNLLLFAQLPGTSGLSCDCCFNLL